jgi:hypothetical protein
MRMKTDGITLSELVTEIVEVKAGMSLGYSSCSHDRFRKVNSAEIPNLLELKSFILSYSRINSIVIQICIIQKSIEVFKL